VLKGVEAYSGPERAAESFAPGELDDLRDLEVPATGMLAMQERGGEPDLVGDPDFSWN
jgi:hypothetical protein